MKKQAKKVYVAMSGGVDSSVAAALLLRQGYEVTGVFMKGWHPSFVECTYRSDKADAMRVCAVLKIPYVELDMSEVYRREIIGYLLEEYKVGRTPNPDVMCNRKIKFGVFSEWAFSHGAEYIATGHYVKLRKKSAHTYAMEMGSDQKKDQSYFLWTLTQNDLSRVLFPVGKYKKTEVRKLAKKFGLPTASKKDSQGVCFVGELSMREFLTRYIPEEIGKVVDEDGATIGTHQGISFYTIGQRRGFSVNPTTAVESPYYVVNKDASSNTLVVSHLKTIPSVSSEVFLDTCNWITSLRIGEIVQGRFRHQQPLEKFIVKECSEGTCTLLRNGEIESLPSGQSLVLYRGSECVGGGVLV